VSALPWMPLHVPDYLADTAHLGALESGAYLHLIFHLWQTGTLPDDAKQLAKIAKVSAHCWKKLSPVLQKFFHDGWKHKRVEKERAKALEISAKRKAAAEQMHRKRAAHAPANAEQVQTHLHLHPQEQKKEEKKESSLRSVAVSHETKSDWPSDAFDLFWKKYPHKVGKFAAQKAFTAAKRSGVPWARVLLALDRYIAEKPPDRAWCNPSTWLNQGRWADEPAKNGGVSGFGGSRSLQDDSRSVSRALDRLGAELEQGTIEFAPRPRLVQDQGEGDLRLLPPGRSTGS
jgi:uncharacterized protein YdaU (DUF1376 family)